MAQLTPHLWQRPLALLLGLWLVLSFGCSSGDMGTVSGIVTADGQPVPQAMVTFYPRPEGRASKGLTDDDGSYELVYTRDEMGAEVGEHMIRITTAVEGGDYGDTIAKEILPAKYNVSSELKREVKPGKNVIDFNLDTSGEIIQAAY